MKWLLTVFLFISVVSSAATVDTVSIYSQKMQHARKCVVIKPNSYDSVRKFPVVYLLHGFGGDYSNWISRVPALAAESDRYQVIIVCPDGSNNSWYFDSPVDSSSRFETYIIKEVISYIDSNYRTIAERKGRAITGLSMGGHGAVFLAFRHTGVFGACGSMSGGMDLMASKNKYDLSKRLGDTAANNENWKNYSVLFAAARKPKDSLAIIIDCGTSDHFYTSNLQLHLKWKELGIPHEFTSRPGGHSWNYWRNAIRYHLLFFSDFFNNL